MYDMIATSIARDHTKSMIAQAAAANRARSVRRGRRQRRAA